MAGKTIAIFHPGEMGAAIGACLAGRGLKAVWASAGRSGATRARALAAGLEDLGPLERAVDAADVVLSVCPPHGALALARQVADYGFRGIYIDANAISPVTARQIGRVLETAGARFVDGGIIGPPPVQGGSSRIYLSGGPAKDVAMLFAGTKLEAIALDGPAGAASALKACYAAWTKGATALLAEWKRSQPDLEKRSEVVTAQARKAWRWIAEMEEIAASFAAAGLPEGFHLAAADVYRRLERFKDGANPPSLEQVTAALKRAAPQKARSGERRRSQPKHEEPARKFKFGAGKAGGDPTKPHRFLK